MLAMSHIGDNFLLTCHVVYFLDFYFPVLDACHTRQLLETLQVLNTMQHATFMAGLAALWLVTLVLMCFCT